MVGDQIVKDFGLATDELSLNETSTFKQLSIEVARIINYLINNDANRLMNLLYRIDLNENSVKKALLGAEGNNSDTLITSMIVEREFQKVVTRIYFSQNPELRKLLKE